MDIKTIIKNKRAAHAAALAKRTALTKQRQGIMDLAASESRENLNEDEDKQFRELTAGIATTTTEANDLDVEIAGLVAEDAADADVAEGQQLSQQTPAGQRAEQRNRTAAGDGVQSEARTYHKGMDKSGGKFLRDVALAQQFRNSEAQARLDRHMAEEVVERGEEKLTRAIGTGAVSGLVVPQYLVDEYSPVARAGRPTLDVMNKHDLPEVGMSVVIPRITTGSSTALQANEGDAVSETNIDDTLLTIPVQTAAGQQSVSRQAVERAVGVEDIVMQDLFRALETNEDNVVINQATTGLSAAAGVNTYTDASPTVPELNPKIAQAASAVEAGMLNYGMAKVQIMHSRRWFWLQSQFTTSWPAFAQPGVPGQATGVNYGDLYGSGFRGVGPLGLPVVVDNNIPTNLGAGTNEDELYVVDNDECHLWEDPDQPTFIRSEEVKLANLQVLFVLYRYFAYTFGRFPSATQKVSGTGLVTPTF